MQTRRTTYPKLVLRYIRVGAIVLFVCSSGGLAEAQLKCPDGGKQTGSGHCHADYVDYRSALVTKGSCTVGSRELSCEVTCKCGWAESQNAQCPKGSIAFHGDAFGSCILPFPTVNIGSVSLELPGTVTPCEGDLDAKLRCQALLMVRPGTGVPVRPEIFEATCPVEVCQNAPQSTPFICCPEDSEASDDAEQEILYNELLEFMDVDANALASE